MQRYFVDANQIQNNVISILDDDAHHISRVMRMEEGDEVIVSDGQSRTVIAKIVELAPKCVVLHTVEEIADSEAAWHVSLAQALPKGDKMELILQKCTELGAYQFIPYSSERVIVQYDRKKEAKRLERWNKIVKEAAEQSHRSLLPLIQEPMTWKQLLISLNQYDLVLFCYERAGDQGHGVGIKDVLQKFKQAINEQLSNPKILVIAGPEGGFSEREAEEVEAAGAALVGLGKRILRAETAGIVAISCVLYEAGEMGGV